MTTETRTTGVRPGIGPLRLAIPPFLVMVLTAAPVGFIGAISFEFDEYGGFDDIGQFARFLSDMVVLVVIAIALPLAGMVALARACFVRGRRTAPVLLGLATSYVLGFAAVVASTFPRDPLSTLVFVMLALALIAPSLAFLYYARAGRGTATA